MNVGIIGLYRSFLVEIKHQNDIVINGLNSISVYSLRSEFLDARRDFPWYLTQRMKGSWCLSDMLIGSYLGLEEDTSFSLKTGVKVRSCILDSNPRAYVFVHFNTS